MKNVFGKQLRFLVAGDFFSTDRRVMCKRFEINWKSDLNPLSPKNDQHQISPRNINSESTEKVMRTNNIITKWKLVAPGIAAYKGERPGTGR